VAPYVVESLQEQIFKKSMNAACSLLVFLGSSSLVQQGAVIKLLECLQE
jgi:hypothetical protein